MIRIVDRNGDKVVQKVTKPDGEVVRYQYGIPGNGDMTIAKDLCDARRGIGKDIAGKLLPA